MVRKLIFALATIASAAACGGGSGGGTPPPTQPPAPVVGRVDVSADSAALRPGTTLQLRAQAFSTTQAAMEGQAFTWSSSAAGVATVNAGGLVTGVAPGTATITAQTGTVTGSMNVTVRAVPVASVAIVPAQDSIVAGLSRQLVVQVRAADGSLLTGRTITYASSNQNAVSVLATGMMAGLAPGVSQVTATVDGVSGSASIKVLPRPAARVTAHFGAAGVLVGSQLALRATATDNTGAPVTGLRWTTSNPAVATVTADGVVRGVAAGEARVTVASGTVTDWVDVAVYPAATAGQGIVQVTATVPARGGERPETGRIVFAVDRGVLAQARARQAGRDGGESRLTSGIVQIAVAAGTGYNVRAISQDYRYPLQRVAGGTGLRTGITVTAGQVTEVDVPLEAPRLELTGPASVTGGAEATFTWRVTAPGLAMGTSLEAGLILEERNTSSSSFPFGGQSRPVFATNAGGVANAAVTFLTPQTPAQYKVRAFVTGDTYSVERPVGGSFGTRWHAFGALDAERILEIK